MTALAIPRDDSGAARMNSCGRRIGYRGTPFENVVCKGNSVYIRIPSPAGGRVRRRTSCATPREAAALLERIDALVCGDAEPIWWPITAVLDRSITLGRRAVSRLTVRRARRARGAVGAGIGVDATTGA